MLFLWSGPIRLKKKNMSCKHKYNLNMNSNCWEVQGTVSRGEKICACKHSLYIQWLAGDGNTMKA